MISCKSSFFNAALKVAPGGVSRQGSERKYALQEEDFQEDAV